MVKILYGLALFVLVQMYGQALVYAESSTTVAVETSTSSVIFTLTKTSGAVEPAPLTSLVAIAPRPTTPAFDIVVVAGQSNAVGLGKGSYTEDSQFATAVNRAKVYQIGRCPGRNLEVVQVNRELLDFWDVATLPNGCATGPSTFYGSAYPFALRLASVATSGRKVLIVPAAQGGTSILRWDRSATSFVLPASPDTTILYDDMVMRVKQVLDLYPGSRVVAVIWRQGEADVSALYNSNNPYHTFITPELYKQKLVDFRYNIRHELTPFRCVPMLYGDMSPQWIPPVLAQQATSGIAAKTVISRITKEVATNDPCFKNINRSVFISSAGTTSNVGDPIHFDAAGQFEMAKRLWSAYQKIKIY